MGILVSKEVCTACKYATTKLFGFETGILRCGICSCIITAKEFLGMECPMFKDTADWERRNNKKWEF